MKDFKRYMVTSALPYANGPVHIGHLAGVYVPSDIYVRYLRLKGKDVVWVCGSDEHGVPITLKARKENKTPQQIVDVYHQMIKNSFSEFGILFDIYSRTSNKVHYQTASDFFKTLYDKNCFIEKTTDQFYDQQANQFLADRYITGTCPHCGNEKAYGDQCEKCGTSLNATDLINPRSAVTGSVPVMRATNHWFLPLEQYDTFFREWILRDHQEWKSNVYGQCKSWLDLGLQPRAVSRDLDWGVPIPLEGTQGKVLYVWFDAPIGYISATKEFTPDWEKYWKDKDTKLVHFIGKDNIVFHCIIFPAMLKAEGSFILPENVPANEFLNLEGEKISTSRNWAVWLHEYLIDFKDKQDVLRYVLTANAPESKDNDFTWKDFQARNNNELVAIFGNFVNRALVLTHKYFEGKVPSASGITEADNKILNEISHYKRLVEDAIETYHFRDALKEAMNIARLGNKYLAETEPWKVYKTDPVRVAAILNVSLQITANLAIIFEPFLPFSVTKLKKMLNLEHTTWNLLGNHDILKEGHHLNPAELLFEQIDDASIQMQIDKLQQTKIENMVSAPANSFKENISFELFQQLDIRIGTIVKAEKVAKTKKLLKFEISDGIQNRIIVSGIAEYYEPEKLIGAQVVFLANLAPRDIKGISSQGMILSAESKSGEIILLAPVKAVESGAEVK